MALQTAIVVWTGHCRGHNSPSVVCQDWTWNWYCLAHIILSYILALKLFEFAFDIHLNSFVCLI